MPQLLPSMEFKKIYARYPALARTPTWGAIDDLLKAGRTDAAWALAEKVSSRNKQLNAQNVLARKIRIERVKLFALQRAMAEDLQSLLRGLAARVSAAVLRADTPKQVRALRRLVAGEVKIFRRALTKWLTDGIWNSVELGMRNTEAALLPIFKDNEESLHRETWLEMNLMEERLTFGISGTLVGRGNPEIAKGSQTYQDATDAAYQRIVAKNNNGLQLSSRIWDMTKRTELDLQKILEQEISQGTSSKDVADEVEKYLADEPVAGPGTYSKPAANAMRLARTETSRAYSTAQAEWAKTRNWVKGIMVTLSSAHNPAIDGDECDDMAGKIVSPDEFEGLLPLHPHCMCFGTIVVKDEYLNVEEAVHA